MISAIREIDEQTVVVEISGGYSDAIFARLILKELGDAAEPTTFPGGYRVGVKGTKGNALRCWQVRDRLAQDEHIEIPEDVNSYVERKKNRQS